MYVIIGPDGYVRDIRPGRNHVSHTKVFSLAKQYKTLTGAEQAARRLGAAYRVIDINGGFYTNE